MQKENFLLQKWYCFKAVVMVVLISFCMFVVQELSEKQSDTNFFTIRERSWVSDFERVASPIFDSSCNPKGALAYNFIFDMQEENQIVTIGAFAGVTQLQQILVNNFVNLQDKDDFLALYYEALPYSKTQEIAFLSVNNLHYNRHRSFKYLSYKSFKTEIYA
tara:strand:+ start:6457 stop:6942 length:486 start_codon:yes stop_codon:yes gene_type:complete